jgi:hypothetical protein
MKGIIMKIKVLPHTYAGEEIIQQSIDAAASEMPAGKSPPSATPIRDAEGKVVAVEVNLPSDISGNELENARSKINQNNGVSKAKGYPITLTEDFEAMATGVSLYLMSNDRIEQSSNPFQVTDTGPIAGTKSVVLTNIEDYIFAPRLKASTLGMTLFTAGEVELKVRNSEFTLGGYGPSGGIAAHFTGAVGTNIFYYSQGNLTPVDTGIAYAVDTTYKFKIVFSPSGYIFYLNDVLMGVLFENVPPIWWIDVDCEPKTAANRFDDLSMRVVDGLLA